MDGSIEVIQPLVKRAGGFRTLFVLSWALKVGNDAFVFSGIIETTGRVIGTQATPEGILQLRIDGSGLADWPAYGASIALSGCCLTAARLDPESREIGFDVVPETVRLTNLGKLCSGDRVNLEASVRPTTRLDGHVVQGHVEGLGKVVAIETQGEWRVAIEAPVELMPCVIPKGSIAVDGVALTIASVDVPQSRFEIALIPTTLDLTTLGGLKIGDLVHLETDVVARAAVHWLKHFGPGATGR